MLWMKRKFVLPYLKFNDNMFSKTLVAGKNEKFYEQVSYSANIFSRILADLNKEHPRTLENPKDKNVTMDSKLSPKTSMGIEEMTHGLFPLTLGVKYLSMHAGFIDSSDPAYKATFLERIRILADNAGESSVTLLLETGQEEAAATGRDRGLQEEPVALDELLEARGKGHVAVLEDNRSRQRGLLEGL